MTYKNLRYGIKKNFLYVDRVLSKKLSAYNTRLNLTVVSQGFTELGKTPGFIFLLLGVCSVDLTLGGGLFVLLLVSEVVNAVLKSIIKRPRPVAEHIDAKAEHGWSFPSAHAQNSAAILLSLAYFSPGIISVFWVLIIICIGLSRVLLEKHYIIDVLSGYLIGGFLCFLFISNLYLLI
ncbi:phosphatase PAP2 family protein [Pseudochelatococcus sp. G4_1912]|uniref:phosphatase PAP2 family protein n=1 Tax=Pseudochelatococcus sp. G4_1912 TaxID=3114288 RepID=UPI0039C6ADD0